MFEAMTRPELWAFGDQAAPQFGAFGHYGAGLARLGMLSGFERGDAGAIEFSHAQTCGCSGCCDATDGFAKNAGADSTNPDFAPGVVVFVADIPGDDTTTATIAVGGSLTSELEVVGDTDWIAITLEAGQTVNIALNGTGANPVSDTYLRFRDASGNLLAENDDGGAGLNSLLRFTAATSGTYYIEVDSYANNKIGEYTLTVEEAQPLSEYTFDEIAVQLTETYWGGSARSWNVGADGQITVNITSLSADGQFLARAALNLWTDVTGIVFTEVASGAEITFQDTASGAYASSSVSGGTITSSTVNISTNWIANYGTGLNTYSFQTYIHEIGHALGLGHGGNYNGSASYASDASYLNDAWSTTIMSYFSQTENTFFNDLNFSWTFVSSPMNGDVVAMDTLYGLSTTTRTGDTRYGFNSTSNRDIHDATLFPAMAYTIVDSGGIDTLDYRGYAQNQVIDLNPEVFMNIGGLIGNVMIGRGTNIENAKGGSGNDTITGNGLENSLVGFDGDDLIYGEGGRDFVAGRDGNDILYGGALNDFVTGGTGDDEIYGGDGSDILRGDPGNDTIYGGNGSDTIQGWTGMDEIYGGNGNDLIEGQDDNDVLWGGGGQDILRGGAGVDYVHGGDGNDTVRGDDGNDVLTGDGGDDFVRGGAGADVLNGGYGIDELTGGGGADDFYFDAPLGAGNVDAITDFEIGLDQIFLDRGVFSALGAQGGLSASAFVTGSNALDADDRIIYRKSTGEIFYDADGSGAGGKVLFATVTAGTVLSASDFQVYGNPLPPQTPLGPDKIADQDILGHDVIFA